MAEMLSSALRKVIFIIILALAAFYISLPREFPIKIKVGPLDIEREFERRDLNISFRGFSINREFD